jgi:hypothetical protein
MIVISGIILEIGIIMGGLGILLVGVSLLIFVLR